MTVTKVREAPGPLFKLVQLKAAEVGDVKDGVAEFDAYASVFDNIDSHGDIVHKGAFTRTLAEWAEKGGIIPLHYNHALFSTDPMDNIGYLKIAVEDGKGLKVTPVLDVADNPKAAQVYRLIKSGRLRELSIGYIPKTYDWSEKDGVEVCNVRDVDLLEVSVVGMASNSLATVTEVRSAMLYGRRKAVDDPADPDAPEADTEAPEEADAEALAIGRAALLAAAEALAVALEAFPEVPAEEDPDAADSEEDEAAKAAATETVAAKNRKLALRARAALALTAPHGAEDGA